jgi:hypothetical protein
MYSGEITSFDQFVENDCAMYDLIGDIHGHADELVELLEKLGYDRRRGHFAHSSRQAVFVGDFIDRGPQIREALAIVRSMVDAGAAQAVMGNHEFNALCFHTPDPERPGSFLRLHDEKNLGQHQATLRQVPAAELQDYLEWFRALPMWLQLDGVRVVHACWDSAQIDLLRHGLDQHGGVTAGFLGEASRKGSRLYEAAEEVLKGKELKLPAGVTYLDKYGHPRDAMRIRWFASPVGQTYASYALTSDEGIPSTDVPAELASEFEPYTGDCPPVFFGHYWLRAARPTRLAPNVACVDYSVAKGGMLVAYRWDGEAELSDEKFVKVSA